MILTFSTCSLFGVSMQTQIIVDQFGWRPSSKKVAIFADPIDGQNNYRSYTPGSTFYVKRTIDGAVVYSNLYTYEVIYSAKSNGTAPTALFIIQRLPCITSMLK